MEVPFRAGDRVELIRTDLLLEVNTGRIICLGLDGETLLVQPDILTREARTGLVRHVIGVLPDQLRKLEARP